MSSRGRKRSEKSAALSPPLEDPHLKVFDFSVQNEDLDLRTTDKAVEVSHLRKNGGPSSEESEDVSGAVQKMMGKKGAGVSKAFAAKKERIAAFTEISFKASALEIKEDCKTEAEQMQKLHSEYAQKFRTLFQRWDLDMKIMKEKQENLANFCQKQHEDFKQSKMVYVKKGKAIVRAHEKFIKNLGALEKNIDNQVADIQQSFEEDMTSLQNQVIELTHMDGITNIRKLFQSIFEKRADSEEEI